jgi:CubicO group peptidase (beta-lactamase class C family)
MDDDHPRATPEELGIDPAKLGDLAARARREVEEGLLPSCQLAVARHGKLALIETIGEAAPGSRYVIFSCTKGLVAGAIWSLLSEKAISTEQRAAEIVPEFGTNGKDVVTIEHLLTHTGGFPLAPLGPPEWSDRDKRLAAFERWRLNWEPGTRFEYHPTSAHWVLAEIVERVVGRDYRAFVHETITEPLGLARFRLGVPVGEQDDVNSLVDVGQPPTPDELEEAIGLRIDLSDFLGEVTQQALLEFGRPENLAVGVPGGGGIATAADVALYYQALLHNPHDRWDAGVLRAGTGEVHCDFPDPIVGVPSHRTLGIVLAGDDGRAHLRGFGHAVSPRAFGHDGAGGQIAFADPVSGISFSYLTNGLDAHVLRQWRRTAGIASRAGSLVNGA